MHICPSCRNKIEVKNVRVAQFGGVGGGMPQKWMPGSSPNARETTGGGQFNFAIDAGLDAVMARTRKDVDNDYMYDANMESRLQQFHTYLEDDTKPYLPFKERQKIKEYENIQRREKFYKDTDKAVFENSPQFVKEHFGPKIEHMISMEDQLKTVRKNDDDRTKASADKVFTLDPEGQEKLASTVVAKIRHTTNTVFGPHSDEEERTDSPDYSQFHTFPMGNSGDMVAGFSQGDVDKYLGGQGLDQLNTFLSEENKNIAFSPDYADADEVDILGERDNSGLPSPISGSDSANKTLEQQLSELYNQKSPDRLPSDPNAPHNMDEKRGQEGLQTKYPFNPLHTTPAVPSI
jgi:hypothetical protein